MTPMTRFQPYVGLAWKVLLFAGFLLVASRLGDWVTAQATPHLTPSTEPAVHRFIMLTVATYVLLMMLPFVPGIELGLGMMAMFGPKIVPLIYGCTVLALVLSFLVGRLVPQDSIANVFRTLHMRRTSNLLEQLTPLGTHERVEFLLRRTSPRFVQFLVRHRLLAVMVALNIPGNALVGGGGGICLVAGFSRLFSLPAYLLAVAIAVAPVPLVVLITGNSHFL